jgi:hypothetical protein
MKIKCEQCKGSGEICVKGDWCSFCPVYRNFGKCGKSVHKEHAIPCPQCQGKGELQVVVGEKIKLASVVWDRKKQPYPYPECPVCGKEYIFSPYLQECVPQNSCLAHIRYRPMREKEWEEMVDDDGYYCEHSSLSECIDAVVKQIQEGGVTFNGMPVKLEVVE